jgi:integral membrane sensor domain MASE1
LGGSLRELDLSTWDYPVSIAGAVSAWSVSLRIAGAFALLYFFAAQFGLAQMAHPSGVAAFWPASGIAVGFLTIVGWRDRPALLIGVVLGTLVASLMSDQSLSKSTLKGICNAGEAALAT